MVNPVPTQVHFNALTTERTFVKTVDTNIVNYTEQPFPAELFTDLLFEDIGGIELINISRHDIIDGIPVNYTLIGNITNLANEFNSNNIIPGFEDRGTYLNQYPLSVGESIRSVEWDDEGNLIIDFADIASDENIEVMILTDGIIYTNA